jgi:signal transduction histidine kinase
LDLSFEQQRRFMADASHELRTPLSSVLGEAEVALSRPHRNEEEYRQCLNAVYNEGTRMSRIVADLLSLARADSGQYPINKTDCSLGPLIEECVRALKHLAEKRGVALSFTPPATEIVLKGDAELLRRLFMNLLDNAVKYTTSGGTVRAELSQDQSECIFTVSDTGRGIALDAQPHIFERFYREDKVRQRSADSDGSGAGLGLSISQWIANLHGGRVTLEKSSENGSVFSVRLPSSQRV